MTDRFTVRAVVVFLGLIAVATVLGGMWLTFTEHQLPDALISIGSTALGGLTGFLISSRSVAEGEPQPVQVTNTPADPVPVDAT